MMLKCRCMSAPIGGFVIEIMEEKTMKKRILSVLLLLAMVLTMIPFAAAAEEVTNDATNGAGENEAVVD